jgi:hypothetical protein
MYCYTIYFKKSKLCVLIDEKAPSGRTVLVVLGSTLRRTTWVVGGVGTAFPKMAHASSLVLGWVGALPVVLAGQWTREQKA